MLPTTGGSFLKWFHSDVGLDGSEERSNFFFFNLGVHRVFVCFSEPSSTSHNAQPREVARIKVARIRFVCLTRCCSVGWLKNLSTPRSPQAPQLSGTRLPHTLVSEGTGSSGYTVEVCGPHANTTPAYAFPTPAAWEHRTPAGESPRLNLSCREAALHPTVLMATHEPQPSPKD